MKLYPHLPSTKISLAVDAFDAFVLAECAIVPFVRKIGAFLKTPENPRSLKAWLCFTEHALGLVKKRIQKTKHMIFLDVFRSLI
jgi:hypothetical protein